MEILTDIANHVLFIILQIAAGCLFSILLSRLPIWNTMRMIQSNFSGYLILLAVFSLCSMVLPLNTYGLIPLIAILFSMGTSYQLVLPAILSNGIFNLTITYTEVGFHLNNAWDRIFLAFFAGILSGILMKLVFKNKEELFNVNNLEYLGKRSRFLALMGECVKTFGGFIIAGAVAESIFKRYFYIKLINFVLKGPIWELTGGVLLSRNATTNRFYLLSMCVLAVLMNIVNLTAMASILKVKGIAFYLVYLSFLMLLLGSMIFIS